MTSTRAILTTVAVLFAVVWVFECTPLDTAMQDRLYDFETRRWLIDEHAPAPRWILYIGPKIALGIFAVVLAVSAAVDWRKHRKMTYIGRASIYIILCLAVIPFTVSRIKAVSRVHCPEQLSRYGGRQPYRKIFAPFPQGCCDPKRPGDCFPAGHASGGFALLAMAFVARSSTGQCLGLALGLAAGWSMGTYQMLKGSHFLSHTVVTMVLAYLMCQILARGQLPWKIRSVEHGPAG